MLKTRAIRKLQKTNLKTNGARLELGAEIRTNENNQESKNNQEIKIQATNIQEEKFDQQRKHLFLPREGEYSGTITGRHDC